MYIDVSKHEDEESKWVQQQCHHKNEEPADANNTP